MELPQHPRIRPLIVGNLPALASPSFGSVAIGATLAEALMVMAERDVGAVVVLDGERVAGIFSERDHARRRAAGEAGDANTPVSTLMSRCELWATPDQPVQHYLELMSGRRVNYLPVIEGGRLLALLSIDELQKETIAQYERVFKASQLDLKILFLQGTYSC